MNKNEIIAYVKTLIKSNTIIKEIEKRNNEMDEMDILYFLDLYSEDYNIKLDCYKSLKMIFKNEYALELLEYLYNYETKKLEEFKKQEEDSIFEVVFEYEGKNGKPFSMLFTTYEACLEFIKRADDPLDPEASLIRKRYIDIDIKKYECISSEMDIIGEVEVFKDNILKVNNNEVVIEYPWYEYGDENQSRLRKKGIIVGEYKPKICDIFKANEVVEVKYDGRIDTGELTNYNLKYNPCSVHIDIYKELICRFEDLTKIKDSD